VARVDVAGRENYAHVDKEFAKVFDVRKRDVVHYLRYEVGDIAYGGAGAEGVVVLVFLGGKKSIRVEVLAKSVAGLPIRFEEVVWGGERWLKLAVARFNKPKNYVVQIKPKLGRIVAEVDNESSANVEGLKGLLVTDAFRKEIRTPDLLLVKAFASHFREVRIEAVSVSHTQSGFALQFKAVALDDEPFEKLFSDIAKKYGVERDEAVKKAKGMWLEVMRKLSADIIQVAEEAAEVGKRGKNVEAGRKVLVEGLRRLFEKKEREALSAGRSEEALAIAVTSRLTLGIVNSPMEWFLLLVGDGVVDIAHKTLGFSAKYVEVAETVLRLLAVWAGAYGAEIRTEEYRAVYSSAEDAAKVLRALLTGEVLEYATSLARSWIGLAGADAPKLISLLALAQLLGVVEGRWAVELLLAHKAATTLVKPEVAKALEGLLSRLEDVEKVEWTERGVNIYFKVRNVPEGAEWAAMLRLHTDFRNFYLYCETCGETSARRILEAMAEELRPAVEQSRKRLGLVAGGRERPKWEGNALELPADVGWPMFLRLWAKKYTTLPVPKEGRGLLRVEVLKVRADGTAKFRLWYYK